MVLAAVHLIAKPTRQLFLKDRWGPRKTVAATPNLNSLKLEKETVSFLVLGDQVA
jgi:hypothetical protein